LETSDLKQLGKKYNLYINRQQHITHATVQLELVTFAKQLLSSLLLYHFYHHASRNCI